MYKFVSDQKLIDRYMHGHRLSDKAHVMGIAILSLIIAASSLLLRLDTVAILMEFCALLIIACSYLSRCISMSKGSVVTVAVSDDIISILFVDGTNGKTSFIIKTTDVSNVRVIKNDIVLACRHAACIAGTVSPEFDYLTNKHICIPRVFTDNEDLYSRLRRVTYEDVYV